MTNFYYDLITKTNINFARLMSTTYMSDNLILERDSADENKFQLRDRKKGTLLEKFDIKLLMNYYNWDKEAAYNNFFESVVAREHAVIDAEMNVLKEQLLHLNKKKKELSKESHVKTIAHFMQWDMSKHMMSGVNFGTNDTTIVFCDDSYCHDIFTLEEICNLRPEVKIFAEKEGLKAETKFVFCDSETYIGVYL